MSKSKRRSDSNTLHDRKTFHIKDIERVLPKTNTQNQLFDYWKNSDSNLYLHGSAGTGKTFCSLYLALTELLKTDSIYKKIVIVRSVVPTRDMGFLPGDLNEKTEVYETPYRAIFDELFQYSNSYDNMKKKGLIEFESTSFLRGQTFNDCIVVVDEMQNLTFQELDTVMTRKGRDCRLVFAGDTAQTDLCKKNDKSGLYEFQQIITNMKSFKVCRFTYKDITRDDDVKEYIMLRDGNTL